MVGKGGLKKADRKRTRELRADADTNIYRERNSFFLLVLLRIFRFSLFCPGPAFPRNIAGTHAYKKQLTRICEVSQMLSSTVNFSVVGTHR